MSKTSNMQSPYEKLKEHLKRIGEYKKFTELLSKDRTITEKFAEIWEREDLVKVIPFAKPKNSYNHKDNNLSEKFILNGNRLCKEKKLAKALLAYNYAVLSGSSKGYLNRRNESETASPNPLVVAYATRSALLYDMERYAESVQDIDRAIEHGYPVNKIEKLEQRRVKCLLKMNKHRDAERKAKDLLEKAKLANESNSINHLECLLKQCRIKNQDEESRSPANSKTDIDLFQRGSEVPLFLKKYNKEKDVNIVSGCVKVNYMPLKGRHLVATKDIEPGEILMIEKAFCSIPKLNEKLRQYCCVCLRRAPIALPCDNCSLVSFCSDDCLTSKHNNHAMECSVLPILLNMKIDEELGLVFRTLLKFTMEEILIELKSTENSKTPLPSGSKEAKAFLQSPTTYLTFTKLEGNLSKRSGDSILESIADAVLGVQLLQMLPRFWERKSKSDSPTEQNFETLTTLGGEIAKLLLNFQCNIHCIKELQIDTKTNILSSNSYDSGYGVYKSFSLMNHSCAPNSLHSSWGDIKFLYSINFIPKGDEILDSYGERYVSHILEDRKHNLKDVYYFDCQCQACSNKWPLFIDLPKTYEIVCPICHKITDKAALKCPSCDATSLENVNENGDLTNTPKLTDIKDIVKEIKIASQNYEACFQELNRYKTSFANIKLIGNYITLLTTYTNVPHMTLVEAQESLLRSFDLMGAFSYKGYNLLD